MAADGSSRLEESIADWGKDRAKADLLNLQWAAIQGQYYKSENSIKYVTKGSLIACDSGTLFSRIDLPIDHGVEAKGSHLPLLTTEDFGSENIPNFGICKMQSTPDITYHCHTQISTQWKQSERNTAANKAALLRADAFVICNKGGIISVKEVNKTPQESLMAIFREQYGFDERTVKLILDVYQKIQTKYPDESQLKRDWRFARLLAEFNYGLLEEEGVMDEYQWIKTAGDASVRVEKSPGHSGYIDVTRNISLREYLITDLNMSVEDFEFLKYKVRIQHANAGEEWEDRKYGRLDNDEKEKLKESGAYSKMNTGLGGIKDVDKFVEIWNQQCDDMCGKIDFTHQQATTSAILATAVGHDGGLADLVTGGSRKREQSAGWLGDATIRNKYGEITFGNDDYMSDLDAENIAYLVLNENYFYIDAIEYYYGDLILTKNRAKLFMEKNNLTEIKEAIYDKTIGEIYNVIRWTASTTEEIEELENYKYENESAWLETLKRRYPPSYNFIKSLENRVPEMGDYSEKN